MLTGMLTGKPIASTTKVTPPNSLHNTLVTITHRTFVNGASAEVKVGVFMTDAQVKFASTAIKMGYTTSVSFSNVSSIWNDVFEYDASLSFVVLADKVG